MAWTMTGGLKGLPMEYISNRYPMFTAEYKPILPTCRVLKPILQQITDLLIADYDQPEEARQQEWETLCIGIAHAEMTKSEVANHFKIVASLVQTYGVMKGRVSLAIKLETRKEPQPKPIDQTVFGEAMSFWAGHPDDDGLRTVAKNQEVDIFRYDHPSKGFLSTNRDSLIIISSTSDKQVSIYADGGVASYFTVRCTYWFCAWVDKQNTQTS
jgi:hypothetical protein